MNQPANDEHLTNRFCPKCGSSIKGYQHQFEKEVSCPKCKQVVRMFEYPTTPPTEPIEIISSNEKTFYLLVASLAIFGLFLFTCLILLSTGNSTTAAFVAFVLLALSIGMIIFGIERHNRVTTLNGKLAHTDDIRKSLIAGIYKWNALEKSIEEVKLWEVKKINVFENELKEKLLEVDEHRMAVQTVAEKYVKDCIANVLRNVTSNNFHTSTTRMEKAIKFCRDKGAIVTTEAEGEFKQEIRDKFEEVVRKEAAREEQRRIKERIRDEEKARTEYAREVKRLASEQNAIERALKEAMARATDQSAEEIDRLKTKLAEFEEKSKRAISMAQQTRAGNVYVISNIGSFGEGVFKVGMTRRLEPIDRVKELSDASVPFKFDVHMMISCDDAPALENALHQELENNRVNKVNRRKEFFRTDIEEISKIVEKNHGKVDYIATPEALEYFESENLHDEDLEFVSSVLNKH